MSNSNQHITLQEAIALTTRYRATRPQDFFISETFDAAIISEILSQPDCQYLRIYLGRKPDNTVVAVLVGADSEEADILPTATAAVAASLPSETGSTSVIAEDGYRCPEFCPKPSPLNP